jgi:hypothetical protein
MFIPSRISRQLLQKITTATTMLMRGSSQSHPVRLIKNAVMTTPKDSAASRAMCVNTLAMLTSRVRPRMNNSAVATFTTMASPGDP